MKTIRLFWSNICVLHRFEKQLLDKAKENLAAKGINLKTEFFGIGYPERMCHHLADSSKPLPDIIVTTDLEVIEDRRIFSRIKDRLHSIKQHFPLRKEMEESPINQWENVLPYLVIPLVFCSNSPLEGSFSGLPAMQNYCFGGIKNSGTKSVIKALWDIYGKEWTRNFVSGAAVTPMPIESFQNVRTGKSSAGIIPSLYTKTANGKNLFRSYPGEGAIALPSYIAALESISLDEALLVTEELTRPEILGTYYESGDLYSPLQKGPLHSWVNNNGNKFLYPSKNWFNQVSPEEFESFYIELVKE